MLKSHRIWNENHPDDKIKPIERWKFSHNIHHKDGNHDNDEPSNQQKMTHKGHTAFHRIEAKFIQKRQERK